MEPTELLTRLEKLPEFQLWKSKHPNFILAHIYIEPGNVQVGFFDPQKSTMTTIAIGDKMHLTFIPDQEIMRSDSDILPVSLHDLTTTLAHATTTSESALKTHYGAEKIIKSLLVVQNISGKTIYNFTYFTQSFKAINIKVSTVDGSLITHSVFSLGDIMKGAKGESDESGAESDTTSVGEPSQTQSDEALADLAKTVKKKRSANHASKDK